MKMVWQNALDASRTLHNLLKRRRERCKPYSLSARVLWSRDWINRGRRIREARLPIGQTEEGQNECVVTCFVWVGFREMASPSGTKVRPFPQLPACRIGLSTRLSRPPSLTFKPTNHRSCCPAVLLMTGHRNLHAWCGLLDSNLRTATSDSRIFQGAESELCAEFVHKAGDILRSRAREVGFVRRLRVNLRGIRKSIYLLILTPLPIPESDGDCYLSKLFHFLGPRKRAN